MARVDPTDYGFSGERKPALTPDIIGSTVNAVVLTVTHAETGIQLAGGRIGATLQFEEFPEHVFWLGTYDVVTLVQMYGDDDEGWRGEKVPLIRKKVFSNRSKKHVEVFNVAPESEWESIMSEAAEAPATGRTRGKKKS